MAGMGRTPNRPAVAEDVRHRLLGGPGDPWPVPLPRSGQKGTTKHAYLSFPAAR